MRLGTFAPNTKFDEIMSLFTLNLKALGYSDDKIEMITVMPMGTTIVWHIDDLVNKGKLTEEEANTILSAFNSAKIKIDIPKEIPEDDMKLPDSNGNITTVTNKNYWWLYLALGVGIGLIFKKKK